MDSPLINASEGMMHCSCKVLQCDSTNQLIKALLNDSCDKRADKRADKTARLKKRTGKCNLLIDITVKVIVLGAPTGE